jgi:hypothetical protein
MAIEYLDHNGSDGVHLLCCYDTSGHAVMNAHGTFFMVVELEDISPSRKPPGEIRKKNATGTHQGKEEERPLVVPVVGAWDAGYCYAVVVPDRPARD